MPARNSIVSTISAGLALSGALRWIFSEQQSGADTRAAGVASLLSQAGMAAGGGNLSGRAYDLRGTGLNQGGFMWIGRKTMMSIALMCALLAVSVACSKHPSDDTIAQDVQKKVAEDPVTSDSDVKVAAKDGKVTLTGTAKSQAAQQKAEDIARAEPGATGVDDQLPERGTERKPAVDSH